MVLSKHSLLQVPTSSCSKQQTACIIKADLVHHASNEDEGPRRIPPPDVELCLVHAVGSEHALPVSSKSTSQTSLPGTNEQTISASSEKSKVMQPGSKGTSVAGHNRRMSQFDRVAAFVFRTQHRLHAKSDPVLCKQGARKVVSKKSLSHEVLGDQTVEAAVTCGARNVKGCSGVFEIDTNGKLAYIAGADEFWLWSMPGARL